VSIAATQCVIVNIAAKQCDEKSPFVEHNFVHFPCRLPRTIAAFDVENFFKPRKR
jgi:hypothetical protein